jgi:hypothetical protein
MVTFKETDELLPKAQDYDDDSNSDGDGDASPAQEVDKLLTPGLNATTRAQGFTKQESMQYHLTAIQREIMESFRGLRAFRKHEPSVRSRQRARLNVIFGSALAITATILLASAGWMAYKRLYLPIHNHHVLQQEIQKHAQAARERAARCQGFDWKMACDSLGPAGARRRHLYTGQGDRSSELEDQLMLSDDPSVTFDDNCLRVYRLELQGDVTFPYHANQLLHLGGVRFLPMIHCSIC